MTKKKRSQRRVPRPPTRIATAPPAAPTDPPRPKGRPVGAKTADRDEDCKILARCKRCHSTDLRVEGIARRLTHCGTDLMTKLPYNLTVWHRSKCVSCGAKLLTRTHHFVPDDGSDPRAEPQNSPS